MDNLLGLYEKALPKEMGWRDKLLTAKAAGFDFMEISIDESEDRLKRLYWSKAEKLRLLEETHSVDLPIMSMCFSGHRRYPLGSRNPDIRRQSLEMMDSAIQFARDLGIRVIQLAGYDVYYEEPGQDTREYFIEGLRKSVSMAEKCQVMLAIEIMDTPFLNSIDKYMAIDSLICSPWLTVYPDIGNLRAWGNDVECQLTHGFHRIVGVHVKETKSLTTSPERKFRDIPFGQGDVDFARIFKKLKALSYNGPFVLEMWGDNLAEPISEIKRSRQFILEKLREGGYR